MEEEEEIQVPMGLRLLGFSEKDVLLLRELRKRIGDLDEFAAETQHLKEQFDDIALKVSILSQLMLMLHPEEYQAATEIVVRTMR